MDSFYPNGYWYFLLVSFISVFSLYGLSTLCRNVIPLIWLGKNTLMIMCLHEPLKRVVIQIVSIVFRQDVELVRDNILFCFFISLMIIGLLVPVCILINKKMPWILGKF